jgi:amino acid transporter
MATTSSGARGQTSGVATVRAAPQTAELGQTQLRAGALGLVPAIMQSVTLIAPAVAATFFLPFITGYAGVTTPLAYPLGFLITLGLGLVLVQLAKHFPSAGGYFTYLSRTLHPRVGFLGAWLMTFYVPTVGGPITAYFGFILHNELKTNYGLNVPWWIAPLVLLPIIAFLAYRGITVSTRLIVLFGMAEMAIVLALATWGLFDPGQGGFNVDSFNPANITSLSGFGLAVVFSVQAFTGWDGAAPLAEETAQPRRNVPRAVIGSILILGVFLVFVEWGIMVGWGTKAVASIPTSAEFPALVLAHRFWGAAWIFMLLALFSSVMAVSQAANNVSTRMWFGMARAGVLPRLFSYVHPTYKTPVNTILLQFVLSVICGLGFGFWLGPDVAFFLLQGLMLVMAVIFVYSLANVGVMWYYWRERRDEFNWFMHGVIPVGTTAALMVVLYESFNPPPAPPYSYGPWIVGAWVLHSVAIMFVMNRRGREQWLMRAGAIVAEAEASA